MDNQTQIAILAAEIVSDSDRLTDIWSQLDYFSKHKTLRDDSVVKEFDVDDLELHEIITRLLTIPSFITKSKAKLKSMEEGEKKELLKKLIGQKEKELAAIKELRFNK